MPNQPRWESLPHQRNAVLAAPCSPLCMIFASITSPVLQLDYIPLFLGRSRPCAAGLWSGHAPGPCPSIPISLQCPVGQVTPWLLFSVLLNAGLPPSICTPSPFPS
eukprot:EG_transcript_7291